MKHMGDYDASTVVYGKFTTFRPSTGAPFTLAGTPALSVYKDNSTTQSTAGVTLTADFDSVTGLHHFAIDTSADGTFYAAGSFFDIVITTGTVDSVSVVGTVVASFTIRKNSALKPTTAARTLDVTANGNAGIDWNNIDNPTTAQNLSGTNIDSDQVVASVTGAVGSVTAAVTLPASASIDITGNITGNLSGSVGSVTGNVGGNVAGSVASVTGNVGGNVAGSVASVTGNVGGNVAGSVGSVTGDIGGLAAGAITDVADAVWDATLADHLDSGSTGEALNAAGAAGDPWITALPGAYGAGTAGFIVGTNLNATVSSRSTYAGADTAGTTTLLTRIATALTYSSGVPNVNISRVNDVAVNGSGTAGSPWGP